MKSGKMRMNNYDEKIDALIKSTLQEEVGNYEVSDRVKEKIDQRIKEEKKKSNNLS